MHRHASTGGTAVLRNYRAGELTVHGCVQSRGTGATNKLFCRDSGHVVGGVGASNARAQASYDYFVQVARLNSESDVNRRRRSNVALSGLVTDKSELERGGSRRHRQRELAVSVGGGTNLGAFGEYRHAGHARTIGTVSDPSGH